jgi:ATP-dependent Clp protease ATP-binding subunit ClpC
LYDEVEKAHPDVFNVLLQILDEGHLTDSFGRKVNFTNTLIIMTSNIGARKVAEHGAGMGFSTSSMDNQKEEMKNSIIQKELKKKFNPEFLNRIDGIVMFKALGENTIKTIIQIEVNKLSERLKEKNYNITFEQTVLDRIFSLNSEEAYGARPIKRIIQNLCEDFLSEEILKGTVNEKDKFVLKYKNDVLTISKKTK